MRAAKQKREASTAWRAASRRLPPFPLESSHPSQCLACTPATKTPNVGGQRRQDVLGAYQWQGSVHMQEKVSQASPRDPRYLAACAPEGWQTPKANNLISAGGS